MTWWPLVSLAQSFAWTAICMWAVPTWGRRLWIVGMAGVLLNISGVAEGMMWQRDHHRVRTSIEARP